MKAAGIGNYLSGASTAAYNNSVNAGSNSANTYRAAGNDYMTGMGQGASTIGTGLNMNLDVLGSIMNNKTKIAMQNSENQGSLLGDIGGAFGAAAGVYNSGMFNNGKRGWGEW
jgi:hypothetical protein